ncbi:MAG: hypothetical protein ACLQOO_23280 [Terriglobia bacterium]
MAAVNGNGIATAPAPESTLQSPGLPVHPARRSDAGRGTPGASEEADHSIEGIVPLREAALNILSEAIRKRDVLAVSPPKERRTELSLFVRVAWLGPEVSRVRGGRRRLRAKMGAAFLGSRVTHITDRPP